VDIISDFDQAFENRSNFVWNNTTMEWCRKTYPFSDEEIDSWIESYNAVLIKDEDDMTDALKEDIKNLNRAIDILYGV
jgi:hypothetical protein